eukprot:scaffold220228_cov28-Tisochrysis_lutea.AAC.1
MKSEMNLASFVSPEVSMASRKYPPAGKFATTLTMGRFCTLVQPSEVMTMPVSLASTQKTN